MKKAVIMDAIRQLGAVVGSFYNSNPGATEEIRVKVATVLRRGTVEGDAFNEAYAKAVSARVRRSPQ
jgi:hypothetical protein